MTSTERESLIRKVEDAFGAIPKPECTKRVARSLDDEWYPSEARIAELRSLDEENDWRDLPPQDIREFSDILFWISPEGFRFYFPAFLRYSILTWDEYHDGVHLGCMEVVGRQPSVIESLTANEARVAAEVLMELSEDDRGSDYESSESIETLRRQETIAEQSGGGPTPTSRRVESGSSDVGEPD